MTSFLYKLKRAHKSLTIWLNGVAGALITGLPMLQDSLPALSQYVPDQAFKYAMGLVIVMNIMLRFKTTTSLGDK